LQISIYFMVLICNAWSFYVNRETIIKTLTNRLILKPCVSADFCFLQQLNTGTVWLNFGPSKVWKIILEVCKVKSWCFGNPISFRECQNFLDMVQVLKFSSEKLFFGISKIELQFKNINWKFRSLGHVISAWPRSDPSTWVKPTFEPFVCFVNVTFAHICHMNIHNGLK
jgi:hypothetical protein